MKEIGSASRREPWFVDKDVTKNTKYFYVIRSVKSARGTILKSAPSVESEAVAPSVLTGALTMNVAMMREGVRVYWNPVKIENEETFGQCIQVRIRRSFSKSNWRPVEHALVGRILRLLKVEFTVTLLQRLQRTAPARISENSVRSFEIQFLIQGNPKCIISVTRMANWDGEEVPWDGP